jgi:transposase
MGASQQQTAAGQSECLHSELSYKRLEKGRFVWPPIVDGAITLTPAQFSVLIEPMDWRRSTAPQPPTQPMLV